MKTPAARGLSLLLAACLAAGAGFFALYRFDNKYTRPLPVVQEGVCALDPQALAEGELFFLVDGWEFYAGALLTPDELAGGGHTPRQVYIGEYPDFSMGDPALPPMGMGTYRLRLTHSGPPLELTLELPEIFSACTIWVDGEPRLHLGDPAPESYRPRAETSYLSFTADGSTELVVAVSNYSHYYGGVYYPPAVGTAAAVSRMALGRAAFYGLFCFSSLAIALFSLSVWLTSRRRNPLNFLYGLLCCAFSLHVCYPFLHWAGSPFFRLPYLLEDFSLFAVMLCAAAVTARLCGLARGRLYRYVVFPAGCAFCVLSAACNLLLPRLPGGFLSAYGVLVSLFKLLLSGWLLAASLGGVRQSLPFGNWLLCGNAVFAVGLLFNVVGANRFEPVVGGWQEEYGGFALVLLFGVLMVRRSASVLRENRRLAARMADEVAAKTRDLSALLSDYKKFLAEVAHDLKAPMASIQNYIELIEDGGAELDQEAREFFGAIDRKFFEMKNRVNVLQEFTARDEAPLRTERLRLDELLQRFYESNRPDMEASGVEFLLELPHAPCFVRADRDRLVRVLENLCYNALSFTPEDGRITLALELLPGTARVRVSDTGCGIAPEELPRVFDRFYTSREDGGGSGLGLYIVKSTIREHGGQVEAQSVLGRGSVFTFTLPLA